MQLIIHAAALLCVAAVQRRNDVNPSEPHLIPAGSVELNAKHGASEGLPLASPLLTSSQDTYQAIESKVSGLEGLLASQEREALEEIRSAKAAFEGRLLSQQATNREIFAKNTMIEAAIKTAENAIQGLRRDANKLQEENQHLSLTLNTLMRNISIAREFALESLNVSKERLQAAPELQVLSDLETKDAEHEHQKRLDSFAVGGMHLSMLRIVRGDPDPHELIAHLDSHLNEASAEKKASLAKLSESFDHLWKQGESQHEELIKQQKQLNETLNSTKIVKDKVTVAVKHLTATRNQLSERVHALGAFGQTLGADVKA